MLNMEEASVGRLAQTTPAGMICPASSHPKVCVLSGEVVSLFRCPGTLSFAKCCSRAVQFAWLGCWAFIESCWARAGDLQFRVLWSFLVLLHLLPLPAGDPGWGGSSASCCYFLTRAPWVSPGPSHPPGRAGGVWGCESPC